MARHRASYWERRTRARHRGQGAVERAYRRAQEAGVSTAVALALISLLLWSSPNLDRSV